MYRRLAIWRVDLLLTTISVRHIKHLCGTVVRRRQTLGFVRHWWAVKDGEVIRGAGHKWRTLWIQWTMDVIVFRRWPRSSLPGCRYSSSLPCTDDGALLLIEPLSQRMDGYFVRWPCNGHLFSQRSRTKNLFHYSHFTPLLYILSG